MLPYLFFLGLVALIGVILFFRWYANANTSSIFRVFRWFAFLALGFLLVFFVFSGKLGWSVMALPALLPIFLRLRTAFRTYKAFSKMTGIGGRSASPGSANVKTKTLEMSLNQETGYMTGIILKGPFTGRKIENLDRNQLFEVLDYCGSNDHEARQILEAYLDRMDPEWRTEYGDNKAHSNGYSQKMDRKEALDVLGLEDCPTDVQIKQAYHNLISHLHPDRGGSDYLAAKINQAKETLLRK